jgi:hypothetical protein
MNRRSNLSISTIAALGLAMLPGSAVAQQKSLKEQLIGTWTLVSWEQDVANGPKFQRYGTSPKGYNIFDVNGRFYRMFARSDLPKLASGNPSTPTPDESKAIVSGAIGLFGTYAVDEAAKVVSLRIESSTFPNQLGTDQRRLVTSITPTELKYENTTAITGGKIYYGLRRSN